MGKWTIGYGAIWDLEGKPVTAHTPPITEEQGEWLLERDAKIATRSVIRLIKVPLSDGQFDALGSWTFNFGGGRLQGSTLRARLNRGDYDGAAGEFPKWVYGGGRKLPGLIRRRRAEQAMFLGSLTLTLVACRRRGEP